MVRNWVKISNVGIDNSLPIFSWLSDTGSLTEALSKFSSAPINVVPYLQSWGQAKPDESDVLSISDCSDQVLIREVELVAFGTCLVKARSIIPSNSYHSHFSFIGDLGAQPLGLWLFNTSGVERGEISVYYDPAKQLWSRRSVFSYKGEQILVEEEFQSSFEEKLIYEC